MMPWMPSWLSGVAILAAAAVVALLAHWLSLRVVLRVPVPGRARGFLQTFVAATTGPSRLAVVVLALWAALPSANFAVAVSRSIGQALLVGLIVLVGWSAMRALETALMTFAPVRAYGISLFASAGAASLVVGLAARPLL